MRHQEFSVHQPDIRFDTAKSMIQRVKKRAWMLVIIVGMDVCERRGLSVEAGGKRAESQQSQYHRNGFECMGCKQKLCPRLILHWVLLGRFLYFSYSRVCRVSSETSLPAIHTCFTCDLISKMLPSAEKREATFPDSMDP